MSYVSSPTAHSWCMWCPVLLAYIISSNSPPTDLAIPIGNNIGGRVLPSFPDAILDGWWNSRPKLLQSSSDVDLSGLLVEWWALRIDLFPSSFDADLGGPLHPRSGRCILAAQSASGGSHAQSRDGILWTMSSYTPLQVFRVDYIPMDHATHECEFPLTLIFYRF